ncbi:MAG TPA: lysophospholipid acyltransferase family protein [Galbitalea sp.]|nr:lysophospholipid acyltransferase family protein [Galbitalea sp.]
MTSNTSSSVSGPSKASGTGKNPEITPIWRLLASLVIPLMGILSKLTILDGDKAPKTGAFVLTPNHYSEIDPLVLGVAMWKVGRMPRFLAKASLFRIPVFGAILRASNQVPVERAGAARGSDPLAAARQITEHGLAVIIYPEGTLTREPDLWPMRGKLGAVRMALDADIPIIPVAHWGTQLVLPRYGKLSLFPRKKIMVKYGDPVDLSGFRDKPRTTKNLGEATELVMAAITELLEGLRGEKAPAERWDPAVHHQADTGKL